MASSFHLHFGELPRDNQIGLTKKITELLRVLGIAFICSDLLTMWNIKTKHTGSLSLMWQ
jgi:hypothetical protein